MKAKDVAARMVGYINRHHRAGVGRLDTLERCMVAADRLFILAEPGSEEEDFFLNLAHALEAELNKEGASK